MKIYADIDIASLARQIKQAGKQFGDNQEQAVKRWGVHTARDLAFRTQAFGKKAAVQKGAIFKDARNVLLTHEGGSKKTPSGFKISSNGRNIYVKDSRYLKSTEEIISWIDRNRTSGRRRTRKIPINERKYCKESLLKRSVNMKHRKASGTAKDGFLDAGDHISRRQKGRQPERIGSGYIKWARKDKRNGTSRKRRRGLRTSAELINNVPYSKDRYVLKKSDSKKSVRNGAYKALKWYKMAMRAEAKKKRR